MYRWIVVAALAIPPAPAHFVTDTASMMSPAALDALDARLASYQRATGHQVVVWIGTSLDGAALDDWAVRTFQAWKIGRKGVDDGVAMFVFRDDKKIDIEVGYGVEDVLTDAQASRIIRETMAPRLQRGDADGAITAGANAILDALAGAPATPQTAGPSREQTIVGGVVLLLLLILAITHPRMAMLLMWSVMSGGRGGFGGGGGGGFSGGGGRSGGGGARGGW